MKPQREWMYPEMQMTGIDYCDARQAEVYDARHGSFRNFEEECRDIVEQIGITKDDVVIDLGAGTGAFAIHAARRCRKIYAVDISKAMLAQCKGKSEAKGLANIEYRIGGFLTYEHRDAPVDAIVSMVALHHIPDLWKFVGIGRCAAMLKPGGRFFLMDVVYSIDAENWQKQLQAWVDHGIEMVSSEFAEEVFTHIRDEFSTLDWIMEGLLNRCGFRIDSIKRADGGIIQYVCTKQEKAAE